ncbi:hypothetical protein FMM79_03065 [Novosphingobium sp. BW1]|nr:hypothetical protein FMM79_03065 [Novosphingobium sp. BW1]
MALLAACSSEPEPQEASSEVASIGDGGMREPALPEPTASATDLVDTNSIPPMLRGRWGLVKLDCTGDPAAAKGLMKVGAKDLEFYESMADMGEIESIAENEVTGAFAFEGEGETWDLDVTLRSPDGGATLVRTDKGADAAPEQLTYTKCP